MGEGVVGHDGARPAVEEVAALLVTLRPAGLADAVRTLLTGRPLDLDEADVDIAWLRVDDDSGLLYVRPRGPAAGLKAVLRLRLRGPATAAEGGPLDPRGRPHPVPGAWLDAGPPPVCELFNVAVERGYSAPR